MITIEVKVTSDNKSPYDKRELRAVSREIPMRVDDLMHDLGVHNYTIIRGGLRISHQKGRKRS